MPNRLAHETSPYLLQHRNNPVDWFAWGAAAIEKARREQKPIFLSIGYSACHWCHVMEHESFENAEIAGLLNGSFVSIKVDREERPDLDQIYMNAVQMLTGRGGWPMSVFLTPELKPFYGGTYWPPHESRGMPGFDQILAAVVDAWTHRRDQALVAADQLTAELQKIGVTSEGSVESSPLSMDLINGAATQLRRSFDTTYGGFGQAPKFPHPMDLRLLLATYQRTKQPGLLEMVRLTLDRMAAGGIYDQLGGGFARYSTDARWLVPHFEKMLYDNALLARAYLDAYLVTGDVNYARVVRKTLDYVLREMTDPAGGFYSTEDADSEGEEGIYYTWTPDEIEAVLGEERGTTFGRVYDVTDSGNFEGRSILNLPKTHEQCAQILNREPADLAAELTDSREKLFAARAKRVRPGCDDKVIVAWNGLMIDTMARACAALGEANYGAAASSAADFILKNMRRNDGRLLHTFRAGKATLDAYLDDYAALANSLVSLYETLGDERWIDEAVRLADVILDKFSDSEGGGFFYTASDHEQLLIRTKELTDSSTPSGNALAATALLRLGKLVGRADYLDAAEATLTVAAPIMERAPLAAAQILLALDDYLGPAYEMVLVGNCGNDDAEQALSLIHQRFLPRCVFAFRLFDPSKHRAREHVPPGPDSPLLDELFAGKASSDGGPVLYICQNFACQEPAGGVSAISAKLDQLK
jgi:uncharacterized protein